MSAHGASGTDDLQQDSTACDAWSSQDESGFDMDEHKGQTGYLPKIPSSGFYEEENTEDGLRLRDLGDNYYTEADLDMLAPLVADERTKMNLLSKRLSREKLKLRPSKEILAQGKHGLVLQAINLQTGELLVIKEVCLRDKAGPAEEIEREIHTMKLLSHRNVVGYRGVQRHDDKIWIVMEHCPGGSLATVLGKFGSLETSVVRRYCKQICEGLSFLHRHGFVHCDVKCANCLLGNDGVVKLADFGASRRLVKMGTNLDASGTLSHMAPEVIQEERIGRQADVWSLGCCVMQMLTMTLPGDIAVNDHSETATLFRWLSNLKTSPPPPPDISMEAQHFISACFVFDPDQRPSILRLLQHPFLSIFSRTPLALQCSSSVMSTSSLESASAPPPSAANSWEATQQAWDCMRTSYEASSSLSMSVASVSMSVASSAGSTYSERTPSSISNTHTRHQIPTRRNSASSVSSSQDSPILAFLRARTESSFLKKRTKSHKSKHKRKTSSRVVGLMWVLSDIPFDSDCERQFETFKRMKGFRSWQRTIPMLLLCSSLLVAPTMIIMLSPTQLVPSANTSMFVEDMVQVMAVVCHFLSIAVSIQPHEADWVSSSGLLLWYARVSTLQFILSSALDASPLHPTLYQFMMACNLRLSGNASDLALVQSAFFFSRLYHASRVLFDLWWPQSALISTSVAKSSAGHNLLLVPSHPHGLVLGVPVEVVTLLMQAALCAVHVLIALCRLSVWRYEFLIISAKARKENGKGRQSSTLKGLRKWPPPHSPVQSLRHEEAFT